MSLTTQTAGRTAGLAIAILTFVGAGCATKGYVAKQVDPINARVTTAEGEIKGNSAEIAKLGEKDGELEKGIARVEERALGAQGAADEAAGRAGQARERADQAQQRADSGYNLAEEGNRKAEHVEKGLANVHNYQMVTQQSVQFAFDSSDLSPEAKTQLASIVRAASDTKDYVVELKGFTDTTGNAKYNLALSERRAQSVVRYLTLEQDIPLYRIHVMGFGSEAPVADNKSRDGRQQNRRVEVSVYKAGTAEDADMPSRTTSQKF